MTHPLDLHPLDSAACDAWNAIKKDSQPQYSELGVEYRSRLLARAEHALSGEPIEESDDPLVQFEKQVAGLNEPTPEVKEELVEEVIEERAAEAEVESVAEPEPPKVKPARKSTAKPKPQPLKKVKPREPKKEIKKVAKRPVKVIKKKAEKTAQKGAKKR